MLKASGSSSVVLNGRGLVLLTYHRSLRDMARSSEKAAALFDYRLWPALCWTASLTALELGPFLGALFSPTPLARGLGILGAVLLLTSTAWMCRFAGQRLLPAHRQQRVPPRDQHPDRPDQSRQVDEPPL